MNVFLPIAATPNQALQRTRPSIYGCNQLIPRIPSKPIELPCETVSLPSAYAKIISRYMPTYDGSISC